MAGQAAKKRLEENRRRLNLLRVLVAVGFVSQAVQLFRAGRPGLARLAGTALTTGATAMCFATIAKIAAPVYDARGELLDGGGDLNRGGINGYAHDILYVTAFVQVRSSSWAGLGGLPRTPRLSASPRRLPACLTALKPRARPHAGDHAHIQLVLARAARGARLRPVQAHAAGACATCGRRVVEGGARRSTMPRVPWREGHGALVVARRSSSRGSDQRTTTATAGRRWTRRHAKSCNGRKTGPRGGA